MKPNRLAGCRIDFVFLARPTLNQFREEENPVLGLKSIRCDPILKNLEETAFNSGENDGSRTISHSSLLKRCRKQHWRDKSQQEKKSRDTRQLDENQSGNGKLND
jgi:hypothetical protein